MPLKQDKMNINIIEEKENPLFNRKEIKAEIESSTSLSKVEAEKLIAEKLSVNPENLKIKLIEGKFGSQKFVVDANVYTSKEDKEKIEVKTKQEIEAEKKAAEEAAKAKAEAEAAAKAAETEAPAEETKTEEKTE